MAFFLKVNAVIHFFATLSSVLTEKANFWQFFGNFLAIFWQFFGNILQS
jgi:hypothetical protein